MALATSPFDLQSGALLPMYSAAYLRGDLALASALAAEHYQDRGAGLAQTTPAQGPQQGDSTAGNAPGWVGRQRQFVRQSPQRIWQRALPLLLGAALLGAVLLACANLVASHNTARTSPASSSRLALRADALRQPHNPIF